jgi:hypothetical protein
MKEELMSKTDEQMRLDVIKDNFDTYGKGANLLLVANAAGLVGCLSTLREYNSTPLLRGIGMPIVLFGLGLLFAISGYVAMSASRLEKTNEVIGISVLPHTANFFWRAYWVLQLLSVVQLTAAIWFCIEQFWRL